VSLCNTYGQRSVADHFAYYVKESDANSLDVLFKRFFGYLTENLHLNRVDQPGAAALTPQQEGKPVNPAVATFEEAIRLARKFTLLFNAFVELDRKTVDHRKYAFNWYFACKSHTPEKVSAAFKFFVDKYLTDRVEDPLGMFFQHKVEVVLEEMHPTRPNVVA
jgi:hypothetical protein